MAYTPRELFGWIELGERRRKGEQARLVVTLRTANPQTKEAAKDANKTLRKLIEESK